MLVCLSARERERKKQATAETRRERDAALGFFFQRPIPCSASFVLARACVGFRRARNARLAGRSESNRRWSPPFRFSAPPTPLLSRAPYERPRAKCGSQRVLPSLPLVLSLLLLFVLPAPLDPGSPFIPSAALAPLLRLPAAAWDDGASAAVPSRRRHGYKMSFFPPFAYHRRLGLSLLSARCLFCLCFSPPLPARPAASGGAHPKNNRPSLLYRLHAFPCSLVRLPSFSFSRRGGRRLARSLLPSFSVSSPTPERGPIFSSPSTTDY